MLVDKLDLLYRFATKNQATELCNCKKATRKLIAMKKLIKSNPIVSFLILTFFISWICWFFPLIYELPKDIFFGLNFVGILGPPIAAFILMHIISDVRVKIKSVKLFWTFFILTVSIITWRFYIVEQGGSDMGGFYPKLSDFGVIGVIITLACCCFLGLNASNAFNNSLKENYIKTLKIFTLSTHSTFH